MQKQETHHIPLVNVASWMGQGMPQDKAALEGELVAVIADYKKYIKEAAEDEEVLMKALRDMETANNEEKARLQRKIRDIQEGWDTQVQVTQCQLNEAQDKLKAMTASRDNLPVMQEIMKTK